MSIRIVDTSISRAEIATLAEQQFGDVLKAVVDIGSGIMAIGGDLHSDEEAALLERGSRQADLWGINLHPGEGDDEWIEFDSMINLRPAQGNRSRGVDDADTRTAIKRVVAQLVRD